MNYYINEEMLQIKIKNIYTAIAIATLLPLRGISPFRDFFAHNKWSKHFLPNHSLRVSYVKEIKSPFLKKLTEFIFNNPVGNLIDFLLMKLTRQRWKAKTKTRRLNKRGLVLSIDATKQYAKPNSEVFQYQLLNTCERKSDGLFSRYKNKAKTVF